MSEKELLKELERIIDKAEFPDDAASIVLAFFRKNLKSLVEIDEMELFKILDRNVKYAGLKAVITQTDLAGISITIAKGNPIKWKEE